MPVVSTTRRAVLVAASAACLSVGKGQGATEPDHSTSVERLAAELLEALNMTEPGWTFKVGSDGDVLLFHRQT